MSIEERQAERAQCSFNIRELTHFLDGSPEETAKLERMMLQIERDPAFNQKDDHNLEWRQQRENSFLKITKLTPFLETDSEEDFAKRLGILSIIDGATLTRVGVHYGLFIQTVRSLGTPEQFQHWVIDKGAARISKFFGCFGMTELTHGSNVANLQTISTFDEETDTFVVNTPNLGATKWWIGGAAHSATHCVVYARLISKGKDYGVKNFVVQLRDVNTGQLLPGVAVGDIGKKMGRDGIDNGWIQFTNVRIPRFNLLSKHTQVDEHGNVTKPKFEQVGYTALVIGRVSMVRDSFNVGKRFITIALRYATTRRQFGKEPGTGLEKKIIDYPHHRRRLFPLLATVFALNSSGIEVTKFNDKVQELARNGDANSKDVVSNMKDLFALSAGMKAFATWDTCKIIDEARQSCGGHGYSAYNGFGAGYSDWVVQCTWEGDNNVLSLSCGRALIQTYLAVLKGAKPGVYTQFLANSHEDLKLTSSKLDDSGLIISAWELLSKNLIKKGADNFKAYTKEFDAETSFEKISSNRFEIAKTYTSLITLKTFHERVQNEASDKIRPVLERLVKLYAYTITSQNLAHFYSSGIVNESNFSDALNIKIDKVNEELRPDIIGLTDAFNLSDYFINSQIGKYHGDIYDSYFKFVNSQSDDKQKPYYYESLYKPFLHRNIAPNDNEEHEDNE